MKKELVLFFTLFFASCSTAAMFKQKEHIYVMVYDMDGNVLDSVAFSLDGVMVGTSDIYGRFLMTISTTPDEKIHNLRLAKQGYFDVEDEIRLRPQGIFYYKMGNAQQFFEMAEKAFDEKNYQEALNNIEKAERIEIDDDVIYLKALVLSKMGRKDEAIEEVRKASRKVDELIGEIGK